MYSVFPSVGAIVLALAAAAPTANPDNAVLDDPRLCSKRFDTTLAASLIEMLNRSLRIDTPVQELNVAPDVRIRACSKVLATAGLKPEQKTLAHRMRAVAKAQKREFDAAIADLDEALKASEDDADSLLTRARVQQFAGRKASALADLDRLIDKNPSVEAHDLRASWHLADGHWDRALKDYSAAIRLKPSDWSVWNSRCWARATRGGAELAAAEFDCNQALEFAPGNGAVLDSRGLVYLKQGRFQEAWNDYNLAVAALTKEPSPLYGRGIAAVRLGKVEEARTDFAKAKAMKADIASDFARLGVPSVE